MVVISGSGPFVLTVFTNSCRIQSSYQGVRQNSAGTYSVVIDPCAIRPLYLNISELDQKAVHEGRIQFKASGIIDVQAFDGAASIDMGKHMHSHASDVIGTLVVSGATGAVLKLPRTKPRLTYHTIVENDFVYDGWPGVECTSHGMDLLDDGTWFGSTVSVQQKFQAACKHAVALHGAHNYNDGLELVDRAPEDVVAVALTAVAGPYTKQKGYDYRGPGLAACSTNQDCDGMALNVLLFVAAIRAAASSFKNLDQLSARMLSIIGQYTQSAFLLGESYKPSSLVQYPDQTWHKKEGDTNFSKAFGHAWAAIYNDTKIIHLETTTPCTSTDTGGVEESIYRKRINAVGGLKVIDGSLGHVASVGVRRHNNGTYLLEAAYTTQGRFERGGVVDVASGSSGTVRSVKALEDYYNCHLSLYTAGRGTQKHVCRYKNGAHQPPMPCDGTVTEQALSGTQTRFSATSLPFNALPICYKPSLVGGSVTLTPFAHGEYSVIANL